MNISSRIPGISRNSGWQAVDAEIAARRVHPKQTQTNPTQPNDDYNYQFQLPNRI
jgi:hypothetical protein